MSRPRWPGCKPATAGHPAIEHSRCDAHVYILYVCSCVMRVVVLSAGNLGSVSTRPRTYPGSASPGVQDITSTLATRVKHLLATKCHSPP